MQRFFKENLACLLVSLASGSTAYGGWGHHHHHAQPIYYYQAAAPAYVPQAPAQASPFAALLPILVEKLLTRLPLNNPQQPQQYPQQQYQYPQQQYPPQQYPAPPGSKVGSVKGDLTDFRGEAANALENTNALLQRHGKELVELRLGVTDLQQHLGSMDESLGADGPIHRELTKLHLKLGITKESMQAALGKLIEADLQQAMQTEKIVPAAQAKIKTKVTSAVKALLEEQFKPQP